MMYPKDLDEYTQHELERELERRRRLRAEGFCDYCLRRSHLPSCKFPDRHRYKKGAKDDTVHAN